MRKTMSTTLECDYSTINYYSFDDTYTCVVQNNLNIDESENIRIVSATGNHHDEKNNEDVFGLHIENKNTKFFPAGLEMIFENLAVIWIENGKIKEISQSDLKHFPSLHSIYLGRNDISVLSDGLFDYNQDLKLISFYNCKISQIGQNVFDKLEFLAHLWIDKNVCIDSTTYWGKTAVQEIIRDVKSTCNKDGWC